MDYIAKVERAIEFIESKLSSSPDLSAIAQEACLSRYHFHRIFLALTGETPGEYIRKRRLTEAADKLLRTDDDLLDIALNTGFETQQSFSRAFSQHFGISPGRYRKRGKGIYLFERKSITTERLKHLKNITMEPIIKNVEGFRVIGMSTKTTLKNNVIPQLWERFMPRHEEIKQRIKPESFFEVCIAREGFSLDDFNEETEFEELAGVAVSETAEIPEGMKSADIPSGKYAVFTHKGPFMELSKTYDYIWGTWIPRSGMEVDMRSDFEQYDMNRMFGPDHPESEVDIYIPLK